LTPHSTEMDIVERLRDVIEMSWDGEEVTDPLCEEAAAEIERLRAVVTRQGMKPMVAYSEEAGMYDNQLSQEARRG